MTMLIKAGKFAYHLMAASAFVFMLLLLPFSNSVVQDSWVLWAFLWAILAAALLFAFVSEKFWRKWIEVGSRWMNKHAPPGSKGEVIYEAGLYVLAFVGYAGLRYMMQTSPVELFPKNPEILSLVDTTTNLVILVISLIAGWRVGDGIRYLLRKRKQVVSDETP